MIEQELEPDVHLQAFTYLKRPVFLAGFGECIDRAGGWILSRRVLSAAAIEAILEIQTNMVQDLYAALIKSGLDLTRNSHRALSECCTRNLYLTQGTISSILRFRIEIHFLSEPLHTRGLSRINHFFPMA